MKFVRIAIWVYTSLLLGGSASAEPCTTAAACTEWVTVGSGSVQVLVYRSFPLETRNLDVTRALVVVHGAGRDAENYFRHAMAAAFLGDALKNTVVISPRFASTNGEGCTDKVAE